MTSVNHYKAKVGALSRSRPDDDPELVAARQNLRAERLVAYVEKTVREFPPLTREQLDRVAVLLNNRNAQAPK